MFLHKGEAALEAIREEGVVIEANGKTANVRIDRTTACAHCKAGCMEKGGVMVTEAENIIGAQAGDTVHLEFNSRAALTAVLLVFGLPLLALLLGTVLAAVIFTKVGYPDRRHLLSISVGAILFFATFIPIKLYDRHIKESGKFNIAVVEILKKASSGSVKSDSADGNM